MGDGGELRIRDDGLFEIELDVDFEESLAGPCLDLFELSVRLILGVCKNA